MIILSPPPQTKVLYYFVVDVANRRAVIKVPEDEGLPDGMCIDNEGMLWLACFSKSRINRYNPNTGNNLSYTNL